MSLERRDFLKLTAATAAVTAFGGLGLDLTTVHAAAELAKLNGSKQTTSVCCYCSVGCGLIVSTAQGGKGRAVNVEGDPDHPINEGSLCPKGASIWQLTENDKRITKVLYRAPNSDKWQVKTYDWALDQIAARVKKARDASFTAKNAKGQEVNRLETIASVGSAAMDNEECWIYQQMLRALGLTYIEHQARI
jgi:formate dehydrogenase major subunit